MAQHASLTPERWSRFTLDQQVLNVASEMQRISKLMAQEDRARLASSYERVLRLIDLTIQANDARSLRRELLRWRDLVAALYVGPEPDPSAHQRLLRVLLTFTPVAARQREPLGLMGPA